MMRYFATLLWLGLACSAVADRLAYLDDICDPYYVHRDFPKLTTPQWIGEPGVEGVVILSIDDMRDPAKYEAVLRPILQRLKQIDGRAPISIFTNQVSPDDPQLAAWIGEGLSLEVHTIDHPCPLLRDGDLAKAKATYDRCVDLMASIPGSQAVAFRMPCCDSLNTPSPRFWTEIFHRHTDAGNYLAIDSSVFNIFTPRDESLPHELSLNDLGESRFRRYLPFPSFVNTIEDYPYPYIIGGLCWEFPCVVPSDWEAQNVQQPNNPETVRDLTRALDATMIKQGVMPIVFHPHGWIRPEQLVEFVDYAVARYGSKVKFLTFREALARINQHLLAETPLRTATGNAQQVRLVDVNEDGYLDVFRKHGDGILTRVWHPDPGIWSDHFQDVSITHPRFLLQNSRILLAEAPRQTIAADPQSNPSARVSNANFLTFHWADQGWQSRVDLEIAAACPLGVLRDVRWHDIDNDGTSELFLSYDHGVTTWSLEDDRLIPAPFSLPDPARFVTRHRDNSWRDAGLRFCDLNGDQHQDLVFADGYRYAVWMWAGAETSESQGWTQVRSGLATDSDAIPPIVKSDGTNNGAWFHSQHLWVQNEYTNRLPDLVQRATFAELVAMRPGEAAASDSVNVLGPAPQQQTDLQNTTSRSGEDSHNNAQSPLGVARSIEESLASFTLTEGASIEVVAAEPEIQDPVAFDWGQDGVLWVAEMRDYPNGALWHGPGDPLGEPGGRIKLLRDMDGDGRFETSHVFLDNVPFPNGVKAWRKGVLISAAPKVLYAEDTDGDHRADVVTEVLNGLSEGNQQHRANGLRWGLDLTLHMANGDSGGDVEAIVSGEKINIRGRDFRFDPDLGSMELTSGQTQFGRCRDNEGNWFGGNNSDPIWHYALEERYLRRNPFFVPPSPRHTIARVPGPAPVFPTSRTVERFNDFDRANRFTSACSPEIYLLDQRHAGDDVNQHPPGWLFVCEPVHNLVHRARLEDAGVSFHSDRASSESASEFLASSDNWSRPVMCRTAPDSSIWIADMYRMVIEHPEWIPMSWQERIDHLAGTDRGRIYRVVLPDVEPPTTDWRALRRLDTRQLVAALDTPHGALRDMVQQELAWRADPDAIAPLRHLVQDATWPLARIPAIYLLARWNELDDTLLSQLITGDSTAVARHAIRIAEPSLANSQSLRQAVLRRTLQLDPGNPRDARLAQQCAYAGGSLPPPDAIQALSVLGSKFAEDPLVCAALLSSLNTDTVDAVWKRLGTNAIRNAPQSTNDSTSKPATQDIVHAMLGSAIGFQQLTSLRQMYAGIDPKANPVEAMQWLNWLYDAIRQHQTTVEVVLGEAGSRHAATILDIARVTAANQRASTEDRLRALKLFGQDPQQQQAEVAILRELITPQNDFAIQEAAFKAFASAADQATVEQWLETWSSLTPAMRAKVLDVVVDRPDWLSLLLDRVEQGDVLPVQVSLLHRQQMLRSENESARNRAERLFATTADRAEIVNRYQSVPELPGDRSRGKEVFAKQCAACHQLEQQGSMVGPDLISLTDKSTSALLVAILDPNRAVEDKYLAYSLLLTDGRQAHGLLQSEAGNAITLATTDGKLHSVLRSQVESLTATGKSLMPEGLEQVISPQSMADLIAYLQEFQATPKQFPGNIPQVAPVRNDRSIRLFAIHAKIFGPSLVFESQHTNLGYWHSDKDHAVWTIDAPRADTYDVQIVYACPPQPRRSRFLMQVDEQRLGAEVNFTDSWDDYRWHRVGTIALPDEPVEFRLSSDGPIEGALFDVQAIHLYPHE